MDIYSHSKMYIRAGRHNGIYVLMDYGAKASPRLRMNVDLRNSPEDGSQRMLNAIELSPGGAGGCSNV